ncbi:MAG TPA: hypothetical protein VMH82_01910 [Myxococcota bacterium]|nr:hypothetical protein [Myxococcota bacterium]
MREVRAPPRARAFDAVERVPLLGLPLRSRLHVELRPDREARCVAFATRAALGIRLRGGFSLEALATDRTAVRESVAIECPRALRAFVVARARDAQRALLANLKQRLEGCDRQAAHSG